MPLQNRQGATVGCRFFGIMGLACPLHYVWVTVRRQRRWVAAPFLSRVLDWHPARRNLVDETSPSIYRGRRKVASGCELSLCATLSRRGARGRSTDIMGNA